LLQATTQHQRKHSKQLSKEDLECARFQLEKTSLDLRTAMGLYRLTDSELFWELQLDTRCLMGWSENVIVVAFRGTASMTNAWSDLQVRACLVLFDSCSRSIASCCACQLH